MCSGFPSGKLKVASTTMPPAIREEPDSDKLSLALEPESAAIFCTLLTKQQISDYSSSLPTSSLNGYVLVDVGGGTVDISAYRIGPAPDFAIDLLHQPKGGPFGGTKVNHEFKAFLEELVNDRGFTRYLDNSDEVVSAKHQAHLNELVNDTFEKQKRLFGNKGGRSEVTGKIAIRLPHSFFMKYRDILERKLGRRRGGQGPDTEPPEVELADQTLRISYSKVEKFFEPVVTGIQECMQEVLEEVEDIDTVYMVGGFGGSRYMIHALQRALGASYKYVVPMHPDLAVISGAVLFRQNPAHINSKRADATYGFRVSIPFDADRHEARYKAVSQSGDQELCQNVFCTIVERGDTIRTDEVFSSVHPASKHDLRRMHVDIYSSLEKDVWYTTGLRPSTDSAESEAEIRKADVRKVGELNVPLPTVGTAERVTQEGSHTAREVELFFDFSHAEAQVKGYDRASGTEVKGVIDYLSVSR